MRNILLLFLFLLSTLKIFSANEIIVAKDGTGDFTTINAALNSIPLNNAEWKTIIVKNGIYDEHVMIKSSYIAIVGESRGGTRIEHNIPRAAWYAINGTNTGTGVVNIATNLHDIVIANMYIRNTFEGSEDYTEVIRSETGTTRLWFINLDVLCLWKDTFAPWGKAGGMYYVSDCNFRGSIDAFCPRGYCYAINSRYTETKSSSPIWHEGVAGEDQKLVIQGGSVHSEYNKNVKLQNSQNYAKFYYLDLALSDSITSLGSSATAYFYGVTGLSGLSWFANSISLEQRKVIDAAWTFDGKWDPENTMPSVLPFAALPQPYNGRYAVSTGAISLKWIPARNASSHKVYFGTSDTPPFVGETNSSFYEIPNLEKNTTYYWKIVTVTADGETTFGTWRFTTSDNINPVQQATLTLVGNNKQTIKLGESISTVKYKMAGATQYSISGLPAGVNSELKIDTITISGKPENAGTFTYSVTTTDAIQNTTVTGYFIVKDPNDTNPVTGDTIPTDYSLSRLNKFITKLDCKTMAQEPTWITKSGSVAWTSGTGYKWGSTSAVLILKVNGCTSVECMFTNSSTSRPIIISDGGSGNEKTAYPTAANSETLVIFTPKTTGDDDITIKTSGSSGLTVTKIVFTGIYSEIQYIFDKNAAYKLVNGNFNSETPVDIYSVSGKLLHKNVESCKLKKGVYIISNNGNRSKVICN
jgi:pectinesterase